MGILNYQNHKASGECSFIAGLEKRNIESDLVVFDIGANQGDYSLAIKNEYPTAQIYAFEPHPTTFNKLKVASEMYGFQAYNCGLGDKVEQLILYDHQSDEVLGTQHASIYKEVIEGVHKSRIQQFDVNITTLDCFIRDNNINKIDLLKIDTEGNELNVLKGAMVALNNNIIDVIHFEFNSMNVISRVFMKDFFVLLHNYKFYRMLSDGLIPLEYDYLICEIFAFQNIVAIRTSSSFLGEM
jgi:FkbM family methyltransferase